MKSRPLFAATYALGTAMIIGLVVATILADHLYTDFGMQPQPLISLIFGNKLTFLILVIGSHIVSVALSLVDRPASRLAAVLILNCLVAAFSLIIGCLITRFFYIIDNLGTEETGPQPGYPFPGFGILVPLLSMALFIPFHIYSTSLLSANRRNDP